MTELDWSPGLSPLAVLDRKRVDIVVATACDIEGLPSRIKRDSNKSVRDLEDLFLDRFASGDVEDKDVFVVKRISFAVSQVVVTAGQHEQDFSIRTLRCAESASGDEIRKLCKLGI